MKALCCALPIIEWRPQSICPGHPKAPDTSMYANANASSNPLHSLSYVAGTCLYVGPADFARGKEVCGVRLDMRRTTTDCDGKYRGTQQEMRKTKSGHQLLALHDEWLAVMNRQARMLKAPFLEHVR